jgi:serine/threonine protein kinase
VPLDAPDDLTGRDIGPYKLLDKIGAGGMGWVYRAVRADAAFDKTVAVKLIGYLHGSPGVESAFRKERRILAGLNHPNIATLYDAGTTPDGQLYLVMEFVSGEPLDVYCRKRNLDLDARLALFIQVCSAVQFAHAHLVVHRDLKPQNILVTHDGQVKLLDFGIAKILSGSAGETETLFSGMTLRYASPEQVSGQPITTASDIYSLGVVLYELLTAKHPYAPTSQALHEWARVICEADPVRPSIAAGGLPGSNEEHALLGRQLRGDLDAILLMALSKQPSQRYTSAGAFADDLRRHLGKIPVIAREPAFWYVARKFAQRYPGGVLAAILIVLTTVTGVIVAAWQARITIRQWREAQTLLAEVRQLRQQAAARELNPSQRQSSPINTTLQIADILKPQAVLFAYLSLALLGSAIYSSRATGRRVIGALAGGAIFAGIWAICKIGSPSALARWHLPVSPAAPGILEVLALPVFLGMAVCFGAMLLLLMWRVERRFGPKVLLGCIVILAAYSAVRGQVWMGSLLEVSRKPLDFSLLLGDTIMWTCGLVLAQVLMRLIAGQARSDRLARS